MKIGVFDSGVGGLAVAKAIRETWPEHQVLLREDKANVPYGLKSPAQLLDLVAPILKSMVDSGCQVIVVACNTVTVTIIDQLRKQLGVPLIGVEPMVYLASNLTRSKVIAVCATPTTLSSRRYQDLKERYTKGILVLEPDCSDWAAMIQNNRMDRQIIERRIKPCLDSGADVIVLACTHYHWIEHLINNIADGRAEVLQPTWFLLGQLKQVLEQLP